MIRGTYALATPEHAGREEAGMAQIVVTGGSPEAGATTIAVGLAHRLAYAGHHVRLERLAGDERAASDAATFASLDFATASGTPLDRVATPANAGAVLIVEAPDQMAASELASALGATLVIVNGTGATPGVRIDNHMRHTGPLAIPEDRLLAAPTVGALVEASGSRILVRSAEGEAAVCEHVVIGAIASDSDEPYFHRYPRKAVITRAEKVDVALSALRTDTVCLVLSGGADPSPYLLDRIASTRTTSLIVAPEGTVETARDLEGLFGRSPFSGDAKVERIGELMARALDEVALERLLAH